MKEEGAVIFLPELEMSIEALRLHLSNIYNIKLEQMNHKMQTGGTADSAMSNDPMIGGTAESSMKRGGRIEQGDYVKVKPQYGNISGEVTFATDNIIVIKNAMGKTYMFHPRDLVHQMAKGGKLGIGDTVYITDDKSMFKGKSGTILSQLTSSTFLVKILVDGNERNVVVRKSSVEHIENLEEGGLMTSDDVYSYDTQEPTFAGGGGVGEDLNEVYYYAMRRWESLDNSICLKAQEELNINPKGIKRVLSWDEIKDSDKLKIHKWMNTNLDEDNFYKYANGGGVNSNETIIINWLLNSPDGIKILKKSKKAIDNSQPGPYGFNNLYQNTADYIIKNHIISTPFGNVDYKIIKKDIDWDYIFRTAKNYKMAEGGGVGEFPPKGELTNKDNFLLKYEKKGGEYEFFVYKPITKEVSGYNQIKHVCLNKDCPQKMTYEQFINYLYAELYLDDTQYADGGGVEDSGLYVIGRTQIDNNAIKDVIEEEGFYAEWNARGGYWFFPEEVDNYDELENQLSMIFDKQGINARFEGIFKKGGRFDSIFNKAKELSKKGYEKSKAYTKQKVKDAQRKVAVDVLNTTQNKVGTRDKDVLDKARVLIINKYQKGGTLVELEKQIPVFERQHIKGYKAYYDAKKRLEAAEKKHNNTMQSKRIIDNYTTLMIKAKKTYSDNIKKELEGKAEGYIGDKKMAKGGATPSQKKKVGKVMHEWKAGKLHSGSKKGPIVKSQEQAVAIALSEAGLAKKAEKGYVIKKDRFGTSIKVAKKGYTQVMGVNGPRFIKNQSKGWKHKHK